MARISLGLIVDCPDNGNYNPALDPLVPMPEGPIVYDPITGLPTTASEIQRTLRMNYPIDWSGGIGGLGQYTDSSGNSYDASGNLIDTSGLDTSGYDLSNLPLDTLSNTDLTDLTAPLSDYSPTSSSDLSVTPAASYSPDPSLVAEINSLPTGSTLPVSMLPSASQLATIATQGTATGLTAAQISQIFTSASAAGINIFKATSSPSLIPGTNLVYNPATGQMENATYGGLTGSQISAISTSSLTAYLPMILLGGGLLLVVMMMGKG